MDRKVWTEELIEVLVQTNPKRPSWGETPHPHPHNGPTGYRPGTAGARQGFSSLIQAPWG